MNMLQIKISEWSLNNNITLFKFSGRNSIYPTSHVKFFKFKLNFLYTNIIKLDDNYCSKWEKQKNSMVMRDMGLKSRIT